MLLLTMLLPRPFLMLLTSIPTHPHLPTATYTPHMAVLTRLVMFPLSLNQESVSAIAIGFGTAVAVEKEEVEDISQEHHRHNCQPPPSCAARVHSCLDDDNEFIFVDLLLL